MVSVIRSWTISKRRAHVVAHVIRNKQSLISSPPCHTYSAPLKSTQVQVNGQTFCVRMEESATGSDVRFGFPEIL